MGRQGDASLFGHGDEGVEKIPQPLPEFLRSGGRLGSGGRVWIINHVPNHAQREWAIARTVHAHGLGLAPGEPAFYPTGHSRDGKVVADNGNTSAPDIADEGFEILQLLRLLWAVQEDIVPV